MLGLGNLLTKSGVIKKFPNDFSFNFDGSNDYLDAGTSLGNTLGDNYSGDLSVSMWFKANATNVEEGLFTIGNFNGAYGEIDIAYSANKIYFSLNANGWNGYINNTSTDWQHIAVVYKAGSESDTKVYINGSHVSFVATSGTFPSSANMDFNGLKNIIGAYYDTSYTFTGLIDEVAVWDTALSASDVTSIYNNGKVIDLSKSASYGTDRTDNLKLWLRCGDKAEPESTTAIARQDFYTDFDGSNDYIVVGNNPSAPLSINFWFNPSASSGNPAIYSTTGALEIWIGYHAVDGWVRAHFGGASYIQTPDSVISANRWYHVVITLSDTTGKIYIDGVNQSLTTSGTLSSPDVSVSNIGRRTDNNANLFTGKISNLSLYQTALDAQTIKQFAKSRFTPMRDNRFSVVDFDGVNDYVVTPKVSLDFTNFSISMWINPNSFSSDDIFLAIADADSSDEELILYNRSATSNTFNAYFPVPNTAYTSSYQIPVGQWSYLVLSKSDDTLKLYANGIEVHSASCVNSNTYSRNIIIGARKGASYGQHFNGAISSVAVYNTAKSAEEVYAIYQQGITYDESSLSGLVGYWRMGDDTSKAYPTIADSSSNSNDGTITNGASDDIVQQMVGGWDLGSFESSSEELGANLVTNSTFDSDISGWSQNNSDSERTISHATVDGRTCIDINDASTSSRFNAQFDLGGNAEDGKVYKISYYARKSQADSSTKDFIVGLGLSNVGGDALNVDKTVAEYDTWEFQEIHIVCGSANNYLQFLPTAYDNAHIGRLFLDDVKVQKVLQSEVSDTHPAIIDVNEPVLGVELMGSDTDFTLSGTQSASTTGTYWVTGANWTISGGKAIYDDGGNTKLEVASSTFQDAGVYKFSFDISDASSGARIKLLAGSNELVASATYQNGTNEVYFNKSSTFGSAKDLEIEGRTEAGTFKIDNVSVKKILGNVGTMTNQDSADLVYSSVLPDQSFLGTGVNSAYNYFDFGGTDEYIDTPQSVDTYPFSVSVWVKPLSGQTAYIFSIANINTDSEYKAIFWSNATSKFTMIDRSSGIFNKVSGALSVDTWYHVVAVFASTSSRSLYVNGVINESSESSGTSGGFTANLDNQAIGALRRSVGSNYGVVEIGQTAIWNKELSSTEVSAIYNLGRHGNLLDSYSDNLKGYWAMGALDAKTGLSDVGDGTIYDRSGNSNHGTATNTESADLKSSPNAEPNGYAKGDTNRSTTTP